MANTAYQSVADYLAAQPPPVRKILQTVRSTIRKAVPQAEEVISYQMPAYKLHGRVLIYFAGWKEHFGIYPAIGGLVTALREELTPYKVTKGAIRFPLDQPVPTRLIADIAKFRAARAAERVKTKGAERKKRPARTSPR